MARKTGTVARHGASFGFITQDDGSEEMFFMPRGCVGFGSAMPPVGTHVSFEVVIDVKSGRPRADNIHPAGNVSPAGGYGGQLPSSGWGAPPATGAGTGVMARGGQNFGFIEQDTGGEMFVIPGSCAAFGGVLPPVGTRVEFEVVADPKTGKPRADNVRPPSSGGFAPHAAQSSVGVSRGFATHAAQSSSGVSRGSLSRTGKTFGWISPDTGGEIFVLPSSFGGSFPPVGTRVIFDVVTDSKTGQPRADNVQPEGQGHLQGLGGMQTNQNLYGGQNLHSGQLTGTIQKAGPQFGFIQQDSGEEPMFVLPNSCGGAIPPPGTRVSYNVVQDPKTGKPRAENVCPEHSSGPSLQMQMQAPADDRVFTGTIAQAGGKFGFIQADDMTMEKLFVMPSSCRACGDAGIPQVGTRVLFSVTTDEKTGRPRAENVRPEAALYTERTGTVRRGGDKYGFIDQDSGEESMFVMPAACKEFGGVIPPPGTRVSFRATIDSKTGKPRADEVRPEGSQGHGKGKGGSFPGGSFPEGSFPGGSFNLDGGFGNKGQSADSWGGWGKGKQKPSGFGGKGFQPY